MSWAWLLVVLAAIPIYFATFLFFELSALSRVANSFLRAAQRKDIGKAQKYLSEENRAPANKRALEAFTASSSISRFAQPKWRSREIANRAGNLLGILMTESGETVPVRITFVKERGVWKIQSVHLENTSLAIDSAPPRDAAEFYDRQAAKEHYEKALALHAAGDFAGAAREYQATVLREPACFPAYGDLGVVLEILGNTKGAIDAFRSVLRLRPDDIRAHSRLAGAFLKIGDRTNAQASLAAAAHIDPDFPPLYVTRGLMRHAERDLKGAIAEYQAAIRLDYNNCEAHYSLGVALLDQGDSQPAMAEFRIAVDINPNYLAAHGNLGNLLLAGGHPDRAIDEYKVVLRLNPNEALAHYNLGVALQQKGRLNEALAEYETALRLSPNSGMFHFAVGAALEEKRAFVRALEHYRKASDLGEPQAQQGIERIRRKISS